MKKGLLFLLIFLVSCSSDPVYKTGNYEEESDGRNGRVRVSVSIDEDGKIQRIDVVEHNETWDIMNNVSSQLGQQIIKYQHADIDVLSGATQTSSGYLDAVQKALEEAQ